MHRASQYMRGKYPPHAKKNVVQAAPITAADVASISVLLPLDANDCYYCACLSVIDGLRAIDVGFFTWSTVKLYYAVYYSLQSILAWDSVIVFRPDKAPYHVKATVGEYPVFLEGQGSHKPMLDCFRLLKANHKILSQDIELVDGFEWMMDKRESANYTDMRFTEPEVPPHYERIFDLGIRKAIGAYLESDALAFDKDHAIVSFPIAVLKCAGDLAKANGGADVDDDELRFLRQKCRERQSVLSPMLTFISETLR